MHSKFSTCIKLVGEIPKCPSCEGSPIKYGRYILKRHIVRRAVSSAEPAAAKPAGLAALPGEKPIIQQRYYCKPCNKTFIKNYSNQACYPQINHQITSLIKESCGIRSISRLLNISTTTLLNRIIRIAANTQKPVIIKGGHFEVDEMCSYIQKKHRMIWIVYALERSTKTVVSFNVGARTNKTLNVVLKTLHYAEAKTIYTDKLPAYNYLIPNNIHSTQYRGTNLIERKNLSIRTQLKRLSRRTICFSKSTILLAACLTIYFWT